ncbi:hypothetical protein XENTR_v10013545 [Xenopus tropicalis]|nr:hypothetical protein XENTR_v10013545 [Xenopus tropicalis]
MRFHYTSLKSLSVTKRPWLIPPTLCYPFVRLLLSGPLIQSYSCKSVMETTQRIIFSSSSITCKFATEWVSVTKKKKATRPDFQCFGIILLF